MIKKTTIKIWFLKKWFLYLSPIILIFEIQIICTANDWLFASEPASVNKTKTESQFESYFTEIGANMGGIQLNGLPMLRYTIGESAELQQIGIACELVHDIEIDAYGHPRSIWRITGLQSSLAPGDRGTMVWQPLSGATVKFVSKLIKRALTTVGNKNWLIRKAASGDYEIRALDSRSWRYHSGLLAVVEHPALGKLNFTTLGAKIRMINRSSESSSKPLFEASYDAGAHPVSIRFGSHAADIFHWSDAGLLMSWDRSTGGTVTFAYHDGLLTSITEPDKPTHLFTWAENPGHERGDSRWGAPIHLLSDGESTYQYTLEHKGFVIQRRKVSSAEEIVTVFNPLRHRLEQRVGGKKFIVIFHGEGLNMTGLERIENGQGEILEEYHYDEQGQVIGIKRKGEPERSLRYDETGRLMDLMEVKSQ